MMEKLQLHLHDLKQTLSCVDGVMYFDSGDLCFPSEGWREPVSIVMDQWITGLLSFLLGHTDSCLLDFMDGPCCVKLIRDDSGAVMASFFRNSRKTGRERTIDPAELTRSIRRALRTYDRTMYQWGQPPRWVKELSVFDQLLKQV